MKFARPTTYSPEVRHSLTQLRAANSLSCRAYGAQAKVLGGFPTSGARLAELAVAFARRQDNAHSLAWALNCAAYAFTLRDEPATVARFAADGIEAAREHHLPQWLASAERSMGWAIHQLGNFNDGMSLLLQGAKRWSDTGAKLHTTQSELALAECFLREGRIVEARAHLNAAREHCTNYAEAYLAAEIDRLESLLLQREQAAPEIIEEYLVKSLNTASKQGARLYELRTATTLASMLADRNDRRGAMDTLAPVFGWFTEGFDTLDLREAKALLEKLT